MKDSPAKFTTHPSNAYTNYNGTMDIASNIASKWLKQYTDAEYTASNAEANGKATAYLLDTTAWGGFKDSTYAAYAVGASTIELFNASYNKKHPDKTIEIKIEESGYDIRWSDGNFGTNSVTGLDPTGDLYIIEKNFGSTIYGMWIASPHISSNDTVMSTTNFFLIPQAIVATGISSTNIGSRPIICLKDTVKLEKQEDGNYKLIQ